MKMEGASEKRAAIALDPSPGDFGILYDQIYPPNISVMSSEVWSYRIPKSPGLGSRAIAALFLVTHVTPDTMPVFSSVHLAIT
jgi:hypothetical protein